LVLDLAHWDRERKRRVDSAKPKVRSFPEKKEMGVRDSARVANGTDSSTVMKRQRCNLPFDLLVLPSFSLDSCQSFVEGNALVTIHIILKVLFPRFHLKNVR
jgi:hypothetical protein